MRYVIIGAGAVGCVMAAGLASAGRDVVLVGRSREAVATFRDAGVDFLTPSGCTRVVIPVAGGPDDIELRVDDVLVLAMKTQDAAEALAAWSDLPVGLRNAGEVLSVVCTQNGLETERLALRWFVHVYGLVVLMGARLLEPGRVAAYGAPNPGILDVGRHPASAPFELDGMLADLQAGGFLSRRVGDIMAWKRAKLLLNIGNALDALAAPDADVSALRAELVDEARSAYAAAGLSVADDEEFRARMRESTLAPVDGAPPMKNSSWQSLARGAGTIETDWLNGEIVRIAREAGVDAPRHAALQRAARAAARTGEAPGSRETTRILL